MKRIALLLAIVSLQGCALLESPSDRSTYQLDEHDLASLRASERRQNAEWDRAVRSATPVANTPVSRPGNTTYIEPAKTKSGDQTILCFNKAFGGTDPGPGQRCGTDKPSSSGSGNGMSR